MACQKAEVKRVVGQSGRGQDLLIQFQTITLFVLAWHHPPQLPQNYSLTPGPSTPGLVSSAPDNLSFCPVSITSGSGGISQAPLLQFSTCHQPVSVSLNAQMLPAQHERESTSMPQAPVGQGCAVPCTVISQGQSTTVTPGQSFATVGPPPLISAAQLIQVEPWRLLLGLLLLITMLGWDVFVLVIQVSLPLL